MAEVLARFPETIVGSNGIRYEAQASGSRGADGLWEAWVEFIPLSGGDPIRTGRETTQPNHADAAGWAGGLGTVYLEGALQRALHPKVMEARSPARAMFDEPAPDFQTRELAHEAVLDPFSVFEKGESLLRRELAALSSWHLVNIVKGYYLSDESEKVLSGLPARTLIDLIVKAVRQQSPVR